MADTNKTRPSIFQRLNSVLGSGSTVPANYAAASSTYNLDGNNVLYRTKNKEEYEQQKVELQHTALLSKAFKRAEYALNVNSALNLTEVQLMYRDAELMDADPGIGTALDIVAEEACFVPPDGFLVNVTSSSERIKSILQDLLMNRLSLNTVLPMITRSTCKYGNTYLLLNITKDNGILGWKQLPVHEMQRFENGMANPYSAGFNLNSPTLANSDATKFVWVGAQQTNSYIPYWNWQIAHFRLLYDSIFLPYGVSLLHKARRHFKMLSMMEDMMLLYRMDKSMERRVFKVNVGNLDEDDIPAYVDDVANRFKRTQIVDPQTGQLDLRKGILSTQDDFFVPVTSPEEPSPIETLKGGENLTAMDDIKYMQNKVCTALRVPKSFLNFEQEKGEGKNLSLLDVRFMRTVNRIQQMLIMELNKVCMIHLYLLGLEDELTNFTLTMNNPSSQAEMLYLENMAKKVTTAKDAVSDPGLGMPIMSMMHAWKNIFGWSDKEIEENLEEMRLEAALSNELKATGQIINRTHIFDKVDNIYGEPGAEYSQAAPDENGEGGGGFSGGGGGGALDFGGDMGMEMGEEGEEGMEDAAEAEGDMAADDGGEAASPMGEAILRRQIKKARTGRKLVSEERLAGYQHKEIPQKPELFDKAFIVNEELDSIAKSLEKYAKSDDEENLNKEQILHG